MTEIEQTHENIDIIKIGPKTIYLIGTAHVSQASADLAEKTINEVKPDAVAVELCESRYKSLKDPDRWKNTDIVTVIKQGKAYVLLSQLVLASFQKKLGKNLQVKPGAEMMSSIKAAEAIGAKTVLADRDISVTLKRTWANLSFFSICKVLFAMLTGLFTTEEIKPEEVERLKTADALTELMKEFSDAFPDVKKTLIEERDQYLAQKIRLADGDTIVAVVGAGHVPGIKHWIKQDVDLLSLSALPKKKASSKVIGWIIPAFVVGLIVYGFFASGSKTSVDMVMTWVAVNAAFAGLGAALALGHPLTILAAAISAPYTALNPFIASGMVAALVEAYIKKPRVLDLENIAEDMSTFKGWFNNRVSRILLIMCFTNLLGSLGTLVGAEFVRSFV